MLLLRRMNRHDETFEHPDDVAILQRALDRRRRGDAMAEAAVVGDSYFVNEHVAAARPCRRGQTAPPGRSSGSLAGPAPASGLVEEANKSSQDAVDARIACQTAYR